MLYCLFTNLNESGHFIEKNKVNNFRVWLKGFDF